MSMLVLFQFDNVDKAITSKLRHSLTMSEQDLTVASSICIQLLDNSSNILLIQMNKNFNVSLNEILPEGQLMAEVISAYKNNTNRHRGGAFPAIVVLGTQPTVNLIYMIPKLVETVRGSARPYIKTIIKKI
ncbi:unnamed protein product [Cunninghamella echinulata]